MGKATVDECLPHNVLKEMNYYVYIYVDPRTDAIFYVGKGKGNRYLSHLSDMSDSEKTSRIAEIRDAGCEPRIEILAHGFPSEDLALRVEAAAIDLLWESKELTNAVRGQRSQDLGRMRIEQIKAKYSADPVQISEPAILFKIQRRFRYGMSPAELYDVTRGIWKINEQRCQEARYAFAVYDHVIQEVYAISKWFQAGETFTSRADLQGVKDSGRFEFVGRRADDAIRNKYLNRSVDAYFTAGARNVFAYCNC